MKQKHVFFHLFSKLFDITVVSFGAMIPNKTNQICCVVEYQNPQPPTYCHIIHVTFDVASYGMLWVLYNYTNQVVPPFECKDKWLYRKSLNTFEYQ